MSQAAIIISVSDQDHSHANGLSGNWIVPAKKVKEPFSILVVYPTVEIQDIGDQRRVTHLLRARPIAADIVGVPWKSGDRMIGGSDAAAHGHGVTGSREKWGLLLCDAEPDLPKELLDAIEAEILFLNDNLPDVKMRADKKSGAIVATNLYEAPGEFDKRVELAMTVQLLREDFTKECRSLVTAAEIARAKTNLLQEDQRLVGEADRMWARPQEQQNITELHRSACSRLGQERPWAYVPKQLVGCPGCGSMIKDNVLKCPSCNGWLDEGIMALTIMTPKERRVKMYPEQFDREPVSVTGPVKGK